MLQPQQSQQQPPLLNFPPDDEELKRKFLEIEEAYLNTSSSYRFIHPFYNLVTPEEAQNYSYQKLISYSSSSSSGVIVRIPESVYNESQQQHINPDPQCFVPVFACSVEDIRKRLNYQQTEVEQRQRVRLEELQTVELQQLQIKSKLELWKRWEKLRMEQSRLRVRVYSLFCQLQYGIRLSNVYELKREEEEFKRRLMEMNLLLKSVMKDKLQQSQIKLNNLNSVNEEDLEEDEVMGMIHQLNSSLEILKKKLKEKTQFVEEIKRDYVSASGGGGGKSVNKK